MTPTTPQSDMLGVGGLNFQSINQPQQFRDSQSADAYASFSGATHNQSSTPVQQQRFENNASDGAAAAAAVSFSSNNQFASVFQQPNPFANTSSATPPNATQVQALVMPTSGSNQLPGYYNSMIGNNQISAAATTAAHATGSSQNFAGLGSPIDQALVNQATGVVGNSMNIKLEGDNSQVDSNAAAFSASQNDTAIKQSSDLSATENLNFGSNNHPKLSAKVDLEIWIKFAIFVKIFLSKSLSKRIRL